MDSDEKVRLLSADAVQDKEKGEKENFVPGRDAACAGCAVPAVSKMPGITEVKIPGGTMPMMRTLLTSACSLTCNYCATRAGRKIRRASFKPKELADAFMTAYRRKWAKGLFLTSGIPGSPVAMMDRMIEAIEILRVKYDYKDYIHLKILPGCTEDQIEKAASLATRISINVEAPAQEFLSFLAPEKNFQKSFSHLMYAGNLIKRARLQENLNIAKGGVTTQFVVGASTENDSQILKLVSSLESQKLLHHAHFSAFVPVSDTPFSHLRSTPLLRSVRLYQAERLLRQYKFSLSEISFDENGNLPHEADPKMIYAVMNPEKFPVEVTRASYEELLRVPGIGAQTAWKLVNMRRKVAFRDMRDLSRLGILPKNAVPFITLRGKKLGTLPFFQKQKNMSHEQLSLFDVHYDRLAQYRRFTTESFSPGAFR